MSTATDIAIKPSKHRRLDLPAAPLFVGAIYVVSVLVGVLFMAVVTIFDLDPDGRGVALEMVVGISLFGTAALVVGILVGRPLSSTEARSRKGAVIFGVLSLLTCIFVWSGAPGVFGAIAAWLGGLTRGRTAVTGAPGVFARIGLAVAIGNCLFTVVGTIVDILIRM